MSAWLGPVRCGDRAVVTRPPRVHRAPRPTRRARPDPRGREHPAARRRGRRAGPRRPGPPDDAARRDRVDQPHRRSTGLGRRGRTRGGDGREDRDVGVDEPAGVGRVRAADAILGRSRRGRGTGRGVDHLLDAPGRPRVRSVAIEPAGHRTTTRSSAGGAGHAPSARDARPTRGPQRPRHRHPGRARGCVAARGLRPVDHRCRVVGQRTVVLLRRRPRRVRESSRPGERPPRTSRPQRRPVAGGARQSRPRHGSMDRRWDRASRWRPSPGT